MLSFHDGRRDLLTFSAATSRSVVNEARANERERQQERDGTSESVTQLFEKLFQKKPFCKKSAGKGQIHSLEISIVKKEADCTCEVVVSARGSKAREYWI